MTKAGDQILAGAQEAAAWVERATSYSHDITIGLFRAALAGSGFFIPNETLDALDWDDVVHAVRDNEHATGFSVSFRNNGAHVRMCA